MGLSYNDLSKLADSYLMEADYAANKFVVLQEQQRLWGVLQQYCDFNVSLTFQCIDWYKDFQKFLYSHGGELNRKLTIDEFMYYGMKFRMASFLRVPKDFADFKSIKIRKPKK